MECPFSLTVILLVQKFSCYFLVTRSYPTLLQPHWLCLLGSSVLGISQARILEWVAVSFSRGSSRHRDPVPVSFIGIGRQFPVFFLFLFFSVHCCHTLFVKPWAQPRHHTEHSGKHRVSQSAPAQPNPYLAPAPGPQARAGPVPTPTAGEQVWACSDAPCSMAPRPLPDILAARGGPKGCRTSIIQASPTPRP